MIRDSLALLMDRIVLWPKWREREYLSKRVLMKVCVCASVMHNRCPSLLGANSSAPVLFTEDKALYQGLL